MDKTYDGKTLLCRIQHDEKNVAGRISFSPERIYVRLVGFEEFIHFRREDDIVLQLEDNKFCTVIAASTSPGSISTATGRNHYLDVDVREAIVGFRPWNAGDLVKEFQFKLSDTNGLVTAPDIKNAITSANLDNPPESKIFEAESNGTTVTISFSYTLGWHDERFEISEVIGNVVFEEAKTTNELSKLIGLLRTFFTMAAGIEVWLSDYWIAPKENCEQPLLGGGSTSARFQLIWPSGKREPPSDYGSIKPSSILGSRSELDRKITSDCLKFWMDNWTEWQHAFSGVLAATREGRVFDPIRIVNACKWLESTPGAKQIKLDVSKELDAITEAAIAKSTELGLSINDRISGAIRQLGTESRNDLLKRLIDRVVSSDDPALKDRFLKDLHKGYTFRGDFAHSKFYHSTDEQFGNYVQATRAVEALAFLLLVKQLPLPNDYPLPHSPNGLTGYLLA